jgi:hypothetical protein
LFPTFHSLLGKRRGTDHTCKFSSSSFIHNSNQMPITSHTPEPEQPVVVVTAPSDSDGEGQLLGSFKSKLSSAGLYQPASCDKPASHDDSTLLYVPTLILRCVVHMFSYLTRRFLRARRYDADKARKQFSDAEAWRRQHDVDELFRTFETSEMELSKKFYPRWTGRRDKVRRNLRVSKIRW